MALKLGNRIRETTTTTGTGTFDLAGAVSSFQTFVAGIGNSNTTYYAVIHRSEAEFEVGVGTVTDATTDTLARTTVIFSSNSNNAVDFSAGTKDVFVALPAEKQPFLDASDNLVIGTGAAGVDYSLTFDGESNDGVITWKEDEDYFEISDDVLLATTEKLYLRDTAISLSSTVDGQADLVADTTIQVTAPTVNIEASTAITLESDSVTLGENGNTDVVLNFNATSNDGVLTWMEDEDYFQFSDDLLLTTTEKLYFRDTDISINSSVDGQLDLIANTEIQIAATTVDINGAVDISNGLTSTGGANILGATSFSDAAITNVGDIQLDSISGDADSNTSIAFSGSDVITVTAGGDTQITINNGSIVPTTDNDIDLGTSSLEFKDAFFDGTVTTDALVADTADINGGTIDGATIGANNQATIVGTTIQGTTITATTAVVPDASDGAALGTTALEWSDLFLADGAVINFGDDQDVTLTHVADTGILLNSTRKIQFNDASQFIHAPSATVLDLAATDEIELTATLIDVVGNFTNSGTIVSAGTVTANAGVIVDNITIDGTEIDLSSGDLTLDVAGDIILDANGGDVFVKDNGTTFGSLTNTSGNLIIKSGTTTAATFSGANVTLAGTLASGAITSSGNVIIPDAGFIGSASDTDALQIEADGDIVMSQDLAVAGALTVTGDFTVNGTTTTVDTTNLTVTDPLVKYGQGSTGTSVDQGFIITRGDGSSSNTANKGFIWDESADEFATIAANTEAGTTAGNVTINDYADIHVGKITADDASVFTSGASFGDANITNVGDIQLDSITGDGDTNSSITFSGSDVITIATGGAGRLTISDGALTPVTDDQIDLGTSSLQFKDAYFDGTVEADAITIGGAAVSAGGATAGFALAMAVAL